MARISPETIKGETEDRRQKNSEIGELRVNTSMQKGCRMRGVKRLTNNRKVGGKGKKRDAWE
jgi:hypothetical protein